MIVARILKTAIESTLIPELNGIAHQQAHADYAWLVTRDSLTRIGLSAHDAFVMANRFPGCANERIESLIDEKYIIEVDDRPMAVVD